MTSASSRRAYDRPVSGPERDPDVLITDSGGRAVRVGPLVASAASVAAVTDGAADLAVLEPLREVDDRGPLRPAGAAPYWEAGTVVAWCYGRSVDPVRVVRDDERGLVSWLAPDSEVLAWVPVDGGGLRERPLAERFTVARRPRVDHWRGPGVLRVAPTGVPWSVWWFWSEGGEFEGHYVNLELTHERPASGAARTHTRDLVLDLWVEHGQVWLKDEDELEAAAASGWCSAAQADAVRRLGERARRELVGPWAWPLDEGWETWRPPAGWEERLSLPAPPSYDG